MLWKSFLEDHEKKSDFLKRMRDLPADKDSFIQNLPIAFIESDTE